MWTKIRFSRWLILTVVCYTVAAIYTLSEAFISIPVMLAVFVFVAVLSVFATKKIGYRVVKLMLKAVTLNGKLKSK